MITSKAIPSILLSLVVPFALIGAGSQEGYAVTYSGGSLPDVKGGESLRLFIDSDRVRLTRKSEAVLLIPVHSITEVSYGEEVHHRIGTAAGLAVVSLGVGAIVAFSKSKKHYVGVTWVSGDSRGGIALQADKNEYRGLIAALEGVSGKTAVNADSASSRHPQSAGLSAPAPESASSEPIVVRFASVPANAEVQVDGEYWGNTPTADLTRLQVGSHTIVVRKAGYEQWERRITLAAGDDRTISAELQASTIEASRLSPSDPASNDLTGATASPAVPHESVAPKTIVVRFSSTPASAEVNIDGEYWGTTPTTDFTRLSAGSHTILVRKVGYEPWERKITLAGGDDRTISAELKPNDASKPRINGLD
jgi:hypothetical protein